MNDKENDIRLIDIYRELTNNYWGILLTANTIIFSIFSGISIFSGYKLIPIIIVILSMLSSFLLIKNSKTVKNIYQKIGENYFQKNISMEDKRKDINNAKIKKREVEKREKITEYILLVEAILILSMILCGFLSYHTNHHYKQTYQKIEVSYQSANNFYENGINKF